MYPIYTLFKIVQKDIFYSYSKCRYIILSRKLTNSNQYIWYLDIFYRVAHVLSQTLQFNFHVVLSTERKRSCKPSIVRLSKNIGLISREISF